jgi:hypothetical protein
MEIVLLVAMMTDFVKIAMTDLMKTALAMLEGVCLRSGHSKAQCGNQCKCKQFFS